MTTKVTGPNFHSARLAAAGLRGHLIDKLPEIRRLGGKKKTTTPHKKK